MFSPLLTARLASCYDNEMNQDQTRQSIWRQDCLEMLMGKEELGEVSAPLWHHKSARAALLFSHTFRNVELMKDAKKRFCFFSISQFMPVFVTLACEGKYVFCSFHWPLYWTLVVTTLWSDWHTKNPRRFFSHRTSNNFCSENLFLVVLSF